MATWSQYRGTIGDRSGLFAAVAGLQPVVRALYPGCYVDLSPSTAIPAVTYIDKDDRAEWFFADPARSRAELAGRTRAGAGEQVQFLAADYTCPLPLPVAGYDLLISLYAPAVWDSCRRYLKSGGLLLANTAYGDADLAALDPGVRLVATVVHTHGRYRLETDGLADFLIPRDPAAADPTVIRRARRGVGHVRDAWGYVFRKAVPPPGCIDSAL